MILNILQYPHPGLRKIATSIEKITPEIENLIKDMLATMYDANGIGLAATQVDKHIQLIVIDVSNDRNQPMIFINPKITATRGEELKDEGCLSFPGIFAKVKRAIEVDVEYFDEKLTAKTLTADGLLAHCLQHELDHLKGIVFPDKLDGPDKDKALKLLLEKQQDETKSEQLAKS